MKQKEFVMSVIRTRKRIMQSNSSLKNKMQCHSVIKRLELQISAYGKKWSSEQWKAFIRRNYEDIKFLIPGNNAEQTRIQKLNELI